MMHVVCLDLEGVLIPEIWKGVAALTGIEALNRTTRDEPDYDKLMHYRLDILDRHKIGMKEIRQVIGSIQPLEGACEFMEWLRERTQVIILSDTFFEFAQPLLGKLNHPTIFCHNLVIDADSRVTGYTLRQKDQKRKAVEALRSLNYEVISAGDSYNDLSMLQASNHGILFHPPEQIVRDYPQFPVTLSYQALGNALASKINSDPYPG